MNEPVAYGRYIENAKMWLVVELDADIPEGYIPLYTHPVKELPNNHQYIAQLEMTVRKQQAEINQQQEEKKALYALVAEQDKKIVELAFKLAYAERGNEIVLEANTRSRP